MNTLLLSTLLLESKAQNLDEMIWNLERGILATLIYAIIGMVMVFVAYKLKNWMLPGNLDKQITEDGNVAVGLVVGATILGISIIVAAAIVG